MKLSIDTCVKALNIAAMNRKSSFQTELAVGLAVFLVDGGTHKAAKANLCSAYSAAGYQCMKVSEIDYKTINRRINSTAQLFHKLTEATVSKWAANHSEGNLLRAMTLGIEPYELYATMDVMRLCEPARAATIKQRVKPNTDILKGPTTGQDNVLSMFRHAATAVAKGARHIETQHLALMVPDDISRDELVNLAHQLLSLANEKLLTA